jgi:hypothetical protein
MSLYPAKIIVLLTPAEIEAMEKASKRCEYLRTAVLRKIIGGDIHDLLKSRGPDSYEVGVLKKASREFIQECRRAETAEPGGRRQFWSADQMNGRKPPPTDWTKTSTAQDLGEWLKSAWADMGYETGKYGHYGPKT